MAWTAPKTNWKTGELVAAADMNAIGENLAALKDRSSTLASHTTPADIIMPGNNKISDIDADNLNLSITTAGGDVLVHFHGSFKPTNHALLRLHLEVDGARLEGDDSILRYQPHHSAVHTSVISFTRLIQNLDAGAHTFKLQWQTNDGSGVLFKGAQFWAREI